MFTWIFTHPQHCWKLWSLAIISMPSAYSKSRIDFVMIMLVVWMTTSKTGYKKAYLLVFKTTSYLTGVYLRQWMILFDAADSPLPWGRSFDRLRMSSSSFTRRFRSHHCGMLLVVNELYIYNQKVFKIAVSRLSNVDFAPLSDFFTLPIRVDASFRNFCLTFLEKQRWWYPSSYGSIP